MDELLSEIKMEDLPLACRHIAQAIGIQAMVKLAVVAGGTTLYIPKLDSVLQSARDRLILKEFNGGNHKELALKYNLSESWVRKIINQELAALAAKNQVSLFDKETSA